MYLICACYVSLLITGKILVMYGQVCEGWNAVVNWYVHYGEKGFVCANLKKKKKELCIILSLSQSR